MWQSDWWSPCPTGMFGWKFYKRINHESESRKWASNLFSSFLSLLPQYFCQNLNTFDPEEQLAIAVSHFATSFRRLTNYTKTQKCVNLTEDSNIDGKTWERQVTVDTIVPYCPFVSMRNTDHLCLYAWVRLHRSFYSSSLMSLKIWPHWLTHCMQAVTYLGRSSLGHCLYTIEDKAGGECMCNIKTENSKPLAPTDQLIVETSHRLDELPTNQRTEVSKQTCY